LKTNALLEGINRINHKPAFIIQGRYDVVCPIYSADKLANQWPVAKYEVIEDAGHSALEPGIRSALVNATENIKTLGIF
jgi:proline iminopeptidase